MTPQNDPFLTPFFALFFHFFALLPRIWLYLWKFNFCSVFWNSYFLAFFCHFLSLFSLHIREYLENDILPVFEYTPKMAIFWRFLTFFDHFRGHFWPLFYHFCKENTSFFLFLAYFSHAQKKLHFLHFFVLYHFWDPKNVTFLPFFSLFLHFLTTFLPFSCVFLGDFWKIGYKKGVEMGFLGSFLGSFLTPFLTGFGHFPFVL